MGCAQHAYLIVSDSCDPVDCSLPGSSVHGISEARILEWVAISFSRVSSWPRNQTQVSCIAGRFFTNWAMREVLSCLQFDNWDAILKSMMHLHEVEMKKFIFHLLLKNSENSRTPAQWSWCQVLCSLQIANVPPLPWLCLFSPKSCPEKSYLMTLWDLPNTSF